MRSAWVCLLALCALQAQTLPSPEEFAGFPIGSDGNLVRWERIVEYFSLTGNSSDRVNVRTLGPSTNGNPFILATISSPENLARLDDIKRDQWKAAHPGDLSDSEASRIASSSPVVVLVTCNIHATEIGSSQMVLELVHRLATEDSRWTANVLDNVVFLLVPSFNPDGQIIVTDWNNRVRGTENVWAPLPWLYHPYVGHDNNRDAFFMAQVESRYVNRILFKEWFPQIYLDEHQQGNSGMRVFVPPFRNPINPNVDPTIWAEAGLIGFAMNDALHGAGFTGVGYDQKYTAWWQGGFLRGAWFHNTVGLLTEVASANLASPVYQTMADPHKRDPNPVDNDDWLEARKKDPNRADAAPKRPPRLATTIPALGWVEKWDAAQTSFDAELALTYALLEIAANQRERFVANHIRMGRNAIEKGKTEAPYAFVIPAQQHDPAAAHKLARLLQTAGVDVESAITGFTAEGQEFGAGSFVIRMAQPFRAYAKDLLEPQAHPDPGDLPLGAMNDQPYDLTAWTLPLQMGVEAVRVDDKFSAELEALSEIGLPKGRLPALADAVGFAIQPGPNNRSILINRLYETEAQISIVDEEFEANEQRFPPGTLWIEGVEHSALQTLVEGLSLEGSGLAAKPAKLSALPQPRVALFRPFTSSMDEGWTRKLLEDHEFRFSPLTNRDVRAGDLESHWDAIVLPGDRDTKSIMRGRDAPTPKEFQGGIGDEGRSALRRFVTRGGTLIAMGDSTEFALDAFELPLRNALRQVKAEEFSCPGCFLRIRVDQTHPIGYGMTEEATAVFKNNGAFEPAPGFRYTGLSVIARYPGSNLLQSGWMRGEKYLHNRIAAAEVTVRRGKVILIGFRPQFRTQPLGTFKLLFNALHDSGVKRPNTYKQ